MNLTELKEDDIMNTMIPAGYMYKKIEKRPDWLKNNFIFDIYSVSNCISDDFADYIDHWRHNGYWLFDAPAVMQEIATAEDIDLAGMTLFYYENYECEFDDESLDQWIPFESDKAFATNVLLPSRKSIEGFDVVRFLRKQPLC